MLKYEREKRGKKSVALISFPQNVGQILGIENAPALRIS